MINPEIKFVFKGSLFCKTLEKQQWNEFSFANISNNQKALQNKKSFQQSFKSRQRGNQPSLSWDNIPELSSIVLKVSSVSGALHSIKCQQYIS